MFELFRCMGSSVRFHRQIGIYSILPRRCLPFRTQTLPASRHGSPATALVGGAKPLATLLRHSTRP